MKKTSIQFSLFLGIATIAAFAWNFQSERELNSLSKSRHMKVAILNDQPENLRDGRTPHLILGELYTLYQWMEKSGGVIGYVPITENSSLYPIQRIPVEKLETSIFSGKKSSKDFIYDEIKSIYRQDSIRQNSWVDLLSNSMNEVLLITKEWLNEESFEPGIDLIGTINRAGAFLCEEEIARSSSKYLVVYSDKEDNIGKTFEGFSCDITVLVVSSSPKTVFLENLNINYLPFESFSSALNYIVQREKYEQKKFVLSKDTNHNDDYSL